MTNESSLNGWIGVLISSIACIVGGSYFMHSLFFFFHRLIFFFTASIVFIDKFFKKSILDNKAFMASSMSLASGVLLFSSLSILFPQAQKRLDNDALLYTCFFGGAAFTTLLTRLIHYLMPDAIHACGESTESCHHHEQDHRHHHSEEQRKLNSHRCDVEYGTIRSSESHFRFHHDDLVHNHHQDEDDTISECPSVQQHNRHESVEETMHHDPGHYYSIGIQTAIAICVHKFPGRRNRKRERRIFTFCT